MKKLTIEEFQTLLEREYIQFAVCLNSFNEDYTDKYSVKMSAHKAKISDISDRLDAPNIFNDDSLLNMYLDSIIPDMGCVKFKYRTDDAREMLDPTIRLSIFPSGGEVGVMVGVGVVYHEIIRNLINDEKLLVKCPETGETAEVEYAGCICPVSRESIKEIILNK